MLRNHFTSNYRIVILAGFLIVFGILVEVRLYQLQIIRSKWYQVKAKDQYESYIAVEPKRGDILSLEKDSDVFYPLASNRLIYRPYIIPKIVKDDHAFTEKLTSLIDIDRSEVYEKLSDKSSSFKILSSKLDLKKFEEVQNQKILGLDFLQEQERYYPEKNLASHVLGFVGFQKDQRLGQYGLEGYYEKELAGEGGIVRINRDAYGNIISLTEKEEKEKTEVRDGMSLFVSLDRVLQYRVETLLSEAVETHEADRGTVIVIDPRNGEILALANFPNFNPNEYNKVEDINIYNNSSIYDIYEPGSTFKPINMAAAIDAQVVSPDTTYVDNGFVKIDEEYTIKNFDEKAYGKMTMTQVLEKSLNCGMIFVNEKLGPKLDYNYITKFGFDGKTGIDLFTETATKLKQPEKWRKSNLATISYGQGIAVTPMQMVSAYTAIANEGKLIQPHVVKEIIHPNGSREKIQPRFIRQVISPYSAITISSMLVSAVENGWGNKAKIPGYKIAGKTGTAQIPYEDRAGYYEDRIITSFVGFGPNEDPKFVILVKLDNPKGSNIWGSNTAAPLFKKIAEFFLNYYQIPPSY